MQSCLPFSWCRGSITAAADLKTGTFDKWPRSSRVEQGRKRHPNPCVPPEGWQSRSHAPRFVPTDRWRYQGSGSTDDASFACVAECHVYERRLRVPGVPGAGWREACKFDHSLVHKLGNVLLSIALFIQAECLASLMSAFLNFTVSACMYAAKPPVCCFFGFTLHARVVHTQRVAKRS